MANIIKQKIIEPIMEHIDHGVEKNLPSIKTSGLVENFEFLLSSKRTVTLSTLIKNGPLILIFIRGTWCPFCRLHLSKLRSWTEKLKDKNPTILVVSSESPEAIQDWLNKNAVTYLFASDQQFILSDYFGVRIAPRDFSQAATFLIDTNFEIRLSYHGKRGDQNYNQVADQLKVN